MPPEDKNSAVDDFFKNLPTEDQAVADIFDEGKEVEAPADAATEKVEAENTPENGAESRKNRRHRRLEKQLEDEKAARIAAEARAQALSGVRNTAKDETIDERLVRLYGADNEEAQRLHMELLRDFATKGKEEALREMEERQASKLKEQAEFESLIDTELEAIEDEFDVDVTSDAPAARKARREFLELVQKLSPKDQSGTITAYADFQETWELYQARAPKPADATRSKELAARTMTKSGTGQPTPKEPTPGFRGWMKDLHINP